MNAAKMYAFEMNASVMIASLFSIPYIVNAVVIISSCKQKCFDKFCFCDC